MKLVWAEAAWQDDVHWQKTDPTVVARIDELSRDARRSPCARIGKPEPLKEGLQGWWSRRITAEHRFVYRVGGKGGGQAIETLGAAVERRAKGSAQRHRLGSSRAREAHMSPWAKGRTNDG